MYDHYIGIDWAQSNMAIARHTSKSKVAKTIDVRSDIGELKVYLKNLKGRTAIAIEETSTSQWLYSELKNYVDHIIVCDPYRNRLLSEGGKSDRVDAEKLAVLLRADLLKPVFHSGDYFWKLRKLVSGYNDIITACVRAKNQRKSIYRSVGIKPEDNLKCVVELFVKDKIEEEILTYESIRREYEQRFSDLVKSNKLIRSLTTIPGIGEIYAVALAAKIIDIRRFPSAKNFWSYCGLIKHQKMSGGRSYGRRLPRYSREMKKIICHATFLATKEGGKNPLRERYEYLRSHKQLSESEATTATRRLLASIIFGVLKNRKGFDAELISKRT